MVVCCAALRHPGCSAAGLEPACASGVPLPAKRPDTLPKHRKRAQSAPDRSTIRCLRCAGTALAEHPLRAGCPCTAPAHSTGNHRTQARTTRVMPSSPSLCTPPPSAAPSPAARYPIAIIGPGALGLHFAARLAAVGPVAVVARDEAASARLRAGVHVGEASFFADAHPAAAAPAADWVIVLVKAADTAAAACTAMRMQPRGVLSLQNGLTVDTLRAHCSATRVDQGITTEGAFRDEAGVHPSGAGETLVPPGFEAVAAMLAAAGLNTRVEAEIDAARLAKLLVNVAINPLAALHPGAQRPPSSSHRCARSSTPWCARPGRSCARKASRSTRTQRSRACTRWRRRPPPTAPACCRTCSPAAAPRSTRSPAHCWRWLRASSAACRHTKRCCSACTRSNHTPGVHPILGRPFPGLV